MPVIARHASRMLLMTVRNSHWALDSKQSSWGPFLFAAVLTHALAANQLEKHTWCIRFARKTSDPLF